MPVVSIDADRMEAQIALAKPEIRDAFLRAVGAITNDTTVAELTRLIESGRAYEALQIADRAAHLIASAANASYANSAERISRWLGENIDTVINFDRVNTRAVNEMQTNTLRIVREFTNEQRAATHNALVDGIRRGLNPRQQAQAFRDSIGLTQYQEQIVRNYRRNLEDGSYDALSRSLRDRRADRGIASAIEDGRTLPRAKIDSLVERYRKNWIDYRAETIARTEALRSAHAGSNAAIEQAVHAGDLDRQTIVRRWKHTNHGKHPRWFHETMNGQERDFDVPFLTGDGVLMMYPGDPSAGVEQVANCACVVTTRIVFNRAARSAVA